VRRRRMYLLVGSVAVVILCGIAAGVSVLVFFVATCLNPPDHIVVVITNVPEDVRFVCLLSESKDQPRLMSWYEGEMLQQPVKVVPRITSFDYAKNDHASAGFVAWAPSERYGVLVKSADGTWRVYWFSATQVPLEKPLDSFSRGEVRIDLSTGAAEPFSEDAVNFLGFQQTSETPSAEKP
jgi:hypothetical protein